MDFWDLTKLIVRRWYVSVPVFLVAIGATIFVATRVEPDYVATSYVQLVPPAVTPKATDETKASARNPWLDLGLASLTKAGMISAQDQKVVEQLKDAGLSDDFTLTQDTQLPIVTFEVIGDDEAQATGTSEQLVKRFSDSVTSLQKEYGAPKEQLISTRRLDLGDNVKESNSKVKRALIAVAGVGVLLAVALTVAVDAWLRRRERSRRDAVPAVATEPPPRRDAGQPAAATATAGNAAAEVTPTGVTPTKRGTVSSGASVSNTKPGKEYGSRGARTAPPGEETVVVLSVPPAEDTIVLPSPVWPARNGRSNGSKRP